MSSGKLTALCMAVIILGSMFYATVKTSTPNVPDTPPKQTTQQQQPTPSVSNEQIQEMRTAYNQVLSDTLKPIYVGCAIRNEDWINVYVNSLWYELNKGQKTELIARCKNTYFGMFGARGIKLNPNTVNIFINLNTNEKILGKWSTFGVSINE